MGVNTKSFDNASDMITFSRASGAYGLTKVSYGPELVTNGDFATDSDWSKGTGWTIAGGVASFSGGTGADLTQTGLNVEANKAYQISFDMTQISGGGFRVVVDTSGSFVSQYFTTTAQHTVVFAVGATSTRLRLSTLGGANFSIDNVSVREIDPLAVSIQMQGRMTYADTGNITEVAFLRWVSGTTYIRHYLRTDSTKTGLLYIQQNPGSVFDAINVSGLEYSPGVLVPFNIASRHGSTFLNGAADSVSGAVNTTPLALPDLSATDFNLGYDYMGTISMLRVWADDLADVGIAEATEPSEVPSLQLTFDNSETSFTIQDWEQ